MSVKKKVLERAKKLDRAGIGRVLVKAGDPIPGNRVPMEDLRDRVVSLVQEGRISLQEVTP